MGVLAAIALLLSTIGIYSLIGAVFLTRFIEGLLYGVGTTDLVTYAGIPVLLLVAALAASYIPARRASRVDALVALRSE